MMTTAQATCFTHQWEIVHQGKRVIVRRCKECGQSQEAFWNESDIDDYDTGIFEVDD